MVPRHVRFRELFENDDYFDRFNEIEQAKPGDLLWFGRDKPKLALEEFQPVYDQTGFLVNWREYPVTHVGVNIGIEGNETRVYHASPIEGRDVVWPLSRFAKYPRYRKIYGISRLKAEYRQTE